MFHLLEGVVDIVELPELIVHACLAGRMQFERLRQIDTRPNDRTNHGDRVEYRLEDRQLEGVVCRQGDEDKGAAAPQAPVGLLKSLRRDCDCDGDIGTAEAPDRVDWIDVEGVDSMVSPKLAGKP